MTGYEKIIDAAIKLKAMTKDFSRNPDVFCPSSFREGVAFCRTNPPPEVVALVKELEIHACTKWPSTCRICAKLAALKKEI